MTDLSSSEAFPAGLLNGKGPDDSKNLDIDKQNEFFFYEQSFNEHQKRDSGWDLHNSDPLLFQDEQKMIKVLNYYESHDFRNMYYLGQHHQTMTIIIFFHLIFYWQWRKRITKPQIEMSYQRVVNERKYYLAFLSLVSHPPKEYNIENGGNSVRRPTRLIPSLDADGGTIVLNDDNHISSSIDSDIQSESLDRIIERGDESNNHGHASSSLASDVSSCLLASSGSAASSNFIQRGKQLFRQIRLRLIRWKSQYPDFLSSFPQLVYISHLLWQFRALEEYYCVYGNGYMRVIARFAVTSIWFNILSLHFLIKTLPGNTNTNLLSQILSSINASTSMRGEQLRDQMHANNSNPNIFTIYEHVANFGFSSFTVVVTSLLVNYALLLPNVPIQIFPFVPFVQLSLRDLGFLMILSILTTGLSCFGGNSKLHNQIQSVWVGLLNGLLFAPPLLDSHPHTEILNDGGSSRGIFGGAGLVLDEYWVNCLILMSFILCSLSVWVRFNDHSEDVGNESTRNRNRRRERRIKSWIFWVDYVGWNQFGIIKNEREYYCQIFSRHFGDVRDHERGTQIV